jgi:hypothetical protein
MEYAIGFIIGVAACCLATCLKTQYYAYSSRGIAFLGYNCSTKLAKYRDSGASPLRVWVKVYKPEPMPHPGNDPLAAGAVEANKNMGIWEATDSAWPNTGDVFLFAWFEQMAGTINKDGPSKVSCTGGSSSPPPPPLPPPPPPPPPPMGSPQKY